MGGFVLFCFVFLINTRLLRQTHLSLQDTITWSPFQFPDSSWSSPNHISSDRHMRARSHTHTHAYIPHSAFDFSQHLKLKWKWELGKTWSRWIFFPSHTKLKPLCFRKGVGNMAKKREGRGRKGLERGS